MGMGRIFRKLSSSFTRLELRKINAGAGMEWGVFLLLAENEVSPLQQSWVPSGRTVVSLEWE